MTMNPLNHPISYATPLHVTESGWLEHVPFGMLLVDLARPKTLVELGTHTGVSYCAFCQAVNTLQLDTACYAVDTWQGDEHAGFYDTDVLVDLQAHHDPLYGSFSRLIPSTFDEAISYFADGSIDFLHIDGCHDYESVKHDFETWLPKLSKRAIVLFHDTNVREQNFGVWRLWDELCDTYPHLEFKHGNGLGLIVIDNYPTQELRELIETADTAIQQLRQFFQQLGSRLQLHRLAVELQQKEQHVQNITKSNAASAKHIENLERIGAELTGKVQEQAQQLTAKDQEQAQQLAAMQSQLQRFEREAQKTTAQLANRARAVEVLTLQVRDKDRHIHNLEHMLTDRERRIHELANMAIDHQHLAQRLNSIESRASWQLLHKLWQTQMRLAAPDTFQGKVWVTLTKGARRALPRRLLSHDTVTSPMVVEDTHFSPTETLRLSTHNTSERYAAWLQRTEPTEDMLDEQRATAKQLSYQPLFSVVVPVHDPPPAILREAIASVQAQTYTHWELCLVDGGSLDSDIAEILNEAKASDARLRLEYLSENRGIAGNSNAAAALATGEFLVLLDHDDLLAPDTLFEVAQALNENANTDIVYFDEDKLSEDGRERSEPFLKPDWSPELLLSANYLMHSVIRRALFLRVGGFREDTEGAQDWDLLLRCTEQTAAIVHIPKFLYHWRQMIGSTAATYEAKPYVFDNQLRIVQEHLRRRGLPAAKARFVNPGQLQVVWPTRNSRVSIVIPTKEKVELLRPCLNSLLQHTAYGDFEVILVDNGSHQPETLAYYDEIRRDSRVRILDYPHPFNYSAANNFGAAEATGDLLLFLNNDIEILDADWLEELVRWAERPEIGAVGAKLLYPDGRIQHTGVIIGMEGHASHIFWGAPEHYGGIFGSSDWYRDYMAVTGACMMMRRTLFEEVGRFDEAYELAFSDIEICLRIVEAGYRNIYTPFARLRHHEGGSRGQHIPVDDILRGYEHMHLFVEQGDPYFNPNLSYAHRIPQLVGRDEVSRSERLQRLCGV